MKPDDHRKSRGVAAQERPIRYLQFKEFPRALKDAGLKGGERAKKAEIVREVLLGLGSDNPFGKLTVTHHGESRIPNCVKYDLGGGWRLVTQQDDKTCTFCFMGSHDEIDTWMRDNKGSSIAVKNKELVRIPGVSLTDLPDRKWFGDQHERALVALLDPAEEDKLLEGLPPRFVRAFAELDGSSTYEDLSKLLEQVPDAETRAFVQTVAALLMAGNVDGAKAHIGLRTGEVVRIDEVDERELVDVSDGENIRTLKVGSPEYEGWLRSFERQGRWQDWFLFLHPAQERIVVADFDGPAQLSGVSGSGKTCVVVRRAIRLAASGEARVLLLTLNRSLAGLLSQLVDAACVDDEIRARIEVKSFFGLAQDLLSTFEPKAARIYDDVTWKLGEHVDEVFREYYRKWANNPSAAVLEPLHRSFNARRVSGELYLREEFDWIRSAVAPTERSSYLDIPRKGRRFPIASERRMDVLAGLAAWEEKMRAVGIIDYLGLTSALARHIDRIPSNYTNVLVDEAQDFGTTELCVVRRLVPEGPNDIFLCGDVAQTILPKHRSLVDAGLPRVQRERIQQNYRNSREILTAAYDLLKTNLHEDMFDGGDLEILDPRFANFGGPVPMALSAVDLEEEIAYARSYAATCLSQDARTVCIAFAGHTSRSIRQFADKLGVTALDGAYDPGSDRLVFSDLEQTKGYEFDCLIIVNCCEDVLPAKDLPTEETFRETCKLYVAMTRAKRELILSFHDAASPWIRAVQGSIWVDGWSSFETIDPQVARVKPEVLPETETSPSKGDLRHLDGRQFIYTDMAIGLSLEAQEKLTEAVDGKGMLAASTGRRVRWANIASMVDDLGATKRHDAVLGVKVAEELRQALHITSRRERLGLPARTGSTEVA